MTRTVSTQAKIRQLAGLVGTGDVKQHEERFIESLQRHLPPGQIEALSDRQIAWMDDLHRRHFA